VQGAYVQFLARCARRVLWLLNDSPIVTGLSTLRNEITLETFLSGRPEPTASLNAENIHIFVVAALAVALALPARGWRRLLTRMLATSALVFVYTLSLFVVQVMTTAQSYTASYLGLNLYTPSVVAFLGVANRGLITVGMLLLPSFLLLLSYASSLQQETAGDGGKSKAVFSNRKIRKARAAWVLPGSLLAAGLALLAFVATPPDAPAAEPVRQGLERIARLNPGSAKPQFALALLLEDRGSLSEALANYQKAVALEPGLASAWFNQGNIRFKQGDYLEAERCYQKVVELNPRHGAAYNNLGDALYKQRLYVRAEESYRKALSVDETRGSTHKNLGETLLRLQRLCEALPHLQRSTELVRGLSMDARLQARIAALREECGESPAVAVDLVTYPAKK
jgi:hypothetical protein